MKKLITLLIVFFFAAIAFAKPIGGPPAPKTGLKTYTVATIPSAATNPNMAIIVTDGNTDTDCETTGGGTTRNVCVSDGTNWIIAGDGATGALGAYTVATLPGTPSDGDTAVVTDGDDAGDCTVGSGTTLNVCIYDTGGSAWVIAGDGAGSGDSFVTHDAPAGTDPVASGTDTLTWDDTAPIVITGNSGTDTITISVSAATATSTGVLEIATDAETVAVTAADRIVTPSSLDNLLAAPPAIGGTTPAAGAFSTLSATGLITRSGTDPTVRFDETDGTDWEIRVDDTGNSMEIGSSASGVGDNVELEIDEDGDLHTTGDIYVKGGSLEITGNDGYLTINDANDDWWIGVDDTGNMLEFRSNVAVGNSVRMELSTGGDLTVTGNDLVFGNAESLSNTTDGSLIIAGSGGTNDEDLKIDLDAATNNKVAITSSTGVDIIDFGSINIQSDTFDVEGAAAITLGSADVTAVTITTDDTGDGTDLVLPAQSVNGSEILNNTVTHTQLAAIITLSDGDLINFGGITMSGTNDEGLVLPVWADTTPSTDQPYLTYDAASNALKVFEGGWVTIGATAAPTDADYLTLSLDGTLSAERVLTESTQGIDFTDGGANTTLTISIDTTEIDATTWSDNANATNTWTFDVSGTNTTMIAGSAMMAFSHDITVTGNDIVFGSAETISNATNGSITLTDGTNEIAIFKTVGSAAAELTFSPAATGGNPIISTTGENDAGIVFQNAEGEEYLLVDSVGTDVNYLKILSSAAGTGADNQVSLTSVGDDTHIGLIVDPKGAGTLTLGTSDALLAIASTTFNVAAGAVTGVTTAAMSGALTIQGAINLGTGGVVFTDDGDGLLTITGAGNGSDEDLTFNFDDTANTVVIGTGTSVALIDIGAINLSGATITGTTAMVLGDDDNFNLGAGAPTTDWYYEYNSTNVGLLFSTADTAAVGATTPMFKILVDSAAAGMTADQDVFGIFRGTTKLFDVDEDGDVTILGKLTITGTADDHFMDLTSNSATPPSAGTNSMYVISNVFKIAEGGTEKDVVTPSDTVTWTGATHNFSGVTSMVLPDTADAAGEISLVDSTDILWLGLQDGAGAFISFDFTGIDGNDTYIMAWSEATNKFTAQAQAAGSPAWQTIADPAGDTDIEHDINEETQFTYTGNFTTGAQFNIEQLTGNPSGGVLLQVKAADANVTAAQIGDGTNYAQISQLGAVTFAGTGSGITPIPPSADGAAIGSATLEYSDLFIADSGVVYLGNDQEVKITHVADVGFNVKHTATADDKPAKIVLQTGETDMQADDVIAGIYFQAPDEVSDTDARLVAAGIEAVSEGDFSATSNATKLSFKTGASETATEKMSLGSAGLLTLTGNLVIPDGGNIGAATDTDAIAIASDGKTTFTQDMNLSEDLLIGDAKYIGAASDPDAMQIASDGKITLTQDFTVNEDIIIGDAKYIGSASAATAIQIQTTGIVTFIDDILIKDAGTIGSASATTAIAIASTGVVTFVDDILIKDTGTIGSASDTDAMSIAADGDVDVVNDFTAGTIASDGTIAMSGALSGATTLSMTHTAPTITVNDSDSGADGTANILFQSGGAYDIAASFQVDIGGTPTTQMTLDGVNSQVLFAQKIDLTSTGIENVGNIADDAGFTVVSASGTVTIESVVFTGGALASVTNISMNGNVGATDSEIDNIYMQAASVIYGGADQSEAITHVDNAGWLIGLDEQLQLGDSGVYIFSDDDTKLDLVADGAIELLVSDEDLTFADGGTNIITIGTNTGVTEVNLGSLNLVTTGTISSGIDSAVLTTCEGTDDTSTAAAFLTDSGESWGTSEYVGMTLYNITDGSSCVVTANNGTTMTCTLAGGTDNHWDSTNVWAVAPGPKQSGNIFYIGSATTILHPATVGYAAFYYSTGANTIKVDPQSGSMQFTLNGTATGTNGEELDSAAAAGDYIGIHNQSATVGVTLGRSGTWTDGGAS